MAVSQSLMGETEVVETVKEREDKQTDNKERNIYESRVEIPNPRIKITGKKRVSVPISLLGGRKKKKKKKPRAYTAFCKGIGLVR